ncbi:MAG: superoxide dismutase family protein [Pseudomonadota bacterium]|nr:superoxide dismutase family protein [Pseudomonadota bacterium]
MMWRLAICALLAGVPASALAQDAGAENDQLSVPIFAAGGKPAGTISMTDTPNGVLIVANFEAGVLAAGEHAMHFHETGDCSDTAAFETAGDHHNPTGAEHGYMPEGGPHAGDLPNIMIVDGQKSEVDVFSPMVRFSDGDAPLLDEDGSALVIHAGADDYTSQPSGESGDRIACAELTGG